MFTFCLPPNNTRFARIFFLKKIHKKPMGIYPIVSSCNSPPTENISQFVDFWLQPFTNTLPSFLKDTNRFVQEIKTMTIPSNSLLVTIDVKVLYTNIQTFLTMKASMHACKLSSALNSSTPNNFLQKS